jgi:hypothetical protein
VVSNERSGPASSLSPSVASPSAPSEARGGSALGPTQTAAFVVGEFNLTLAAAPGAISITVAAGRGRDVYALSPDSLERWADSSRRLLALAPASGPDQRAEFRAPFLFDVTGRAAIAFECEVIEHRLKHRLLVTGAGDQIGTATTTPEVIREVLEAAQGAVALARACVRTSPGG